MRSKLTVVVLITILSIFVNSCITKQEAIALADLFLEGIKIEAPSGFVVGAVISTLWDIINGADKNAKETETANMSKLLVEAYKITNDNNAIFIDSKLYTTPKIKEDFIEQVNASVKFNEEGTYMLLYKIDAKNDVEERNENNNNGDADAPVILGKVKKQNSISSNIILEIKESNNKKFTKVTRDKIVIFH